MRTKIISLKFQTNIDKSGRVTLPPEVFSELHIDPGTRLVIEEKDGKITLEPVEEEPELIEKDGLLIVRPKITGDIKDAVRQNREKKISDLMNGFSKWESFSIRMYWFLQL